MGTVLKRRADTLQENINVRRIQLDLWFAHHGNRRVRPALPRRSVMSFPDRRGDAFPGKAFDFIDPVTPQATPQAIPSESFDSER
jgi:hypothetical protein